MVDVLGTTAVDVTCSLTHMDPSAYVITVYVVEYYMALDEFFKTEENYTGQSNYTFNIDDLTPGTNYTFLCYTTSFDVVSEEVQVSDTTGKITSVTTLN